MDWDGDLGSGQLCQTDDILKQRRDRMSELQDKFVELANKREALKEELKNTKEEMEQLMNDLGVGAAFQSAEGLVYKIEKPKGTFISFDTIGYVRTKRADEKRGSLAKKEAQELGFVL